MTKRYEVRDPLNSGPDDWYSYVGLDEEEAVEFWAKDQTDWGNHPDGSIVLVREQGTTVERRFKITVEWEPVVSAEEMMIVQEPDQVDGEQGG